MRCRECGSPLLKCERCGALRARDEMGSVVKAGDERERFYCHPMESIGDTCYMLIELRDASHRGMAR